MPALSVVSVCWNYGGDARYGSINFHAGGMQSPAGMEFSAPLNGGSIDGVAVFIPSLLYDPHLRMIVSYPVGATVAHTVKLQIVETPATQVFTSIESSQFSITPGTSCQVDLRFRLASFLQTPCRTMCTLCVYDDTDLIAVHRLTVYLLPQLPALPWNTALGQYTAAQPDYLRTDFLDLFLPVDPALFSVSTVIDTLNRSGMYYDILQGATQYADLGGNFKLQKFLNTYALSVKGKLNCTDCATICSAACAAVGIIFPMTRYNAGSFSGFKCNQILAIGVNVWAEPFGGGGFSYHQFNIAQGTAVPDKNTLIYDACLKVDSGLYPNLPDGQVQKTPLLPCGYTASVSNTPIISVSSPFSGQFYRERLARNGETCIFCWSAQQVPGISTILTKLKSMEPSDPYRLLFRAAAEQYQLEEWGATDTIPAEEPALPAELFSSAELTDSGSGFSERVMQFEENVYLIRHYWETEQLNGVLLLASVLANIEAPVRKNDEREPGESSFTVNGTGRVFVRNRQVFHMYALDGTDAYDAALQLDRML